MRKRNIWIVLIVGFLGVIGLRAFLHREPSFEGRSLSQWIWTMNEKSEGSEKARARAVVRMLGTNSIPLLLDWLRQEDRPSMTARFDKVRHRVFFWLVNHKMISNRPIRSLRDFNPSHRAMAMWALPELGSAGKQAAIPTLIHMLGDKKSKLEEFSTTAKCACLTLSKMSPESIDPLLSALSNPERQIRLLAAAALGEIGPAAKAAIPILERRLEDNDPFVRLGTAEVIGKLGGDPDSFVPVVVRTLPELDWTLLNDAMDFLVRYTNHVRAAIPALVNILNKTAQSTNKNDFWMRNDLTNIIRQIDASALPPIPPGPESSLLPDETDDPSPSP